MSLEDLRGIGCTDSAIRADVSGRRWQRFDRAVVLHNDTPVGFDRHRIALLNAGPNAVFTAFTAAELFGLEGWEREVTHLLVPGGTHVPRLPGLPVRIHFTASWNRREHLQVRDLHRAAPSIALAAATFKSARAACGILAAGVQQRIVTADALRDAVVVRTRLRHRHLLLLAIDDIAQGSAALSEIDFVRLCRRHGLPSPTRQAVRIGSAGRRRYLDVEWVLPDGRRVAAEIDGALHLSQRQWWSDQLRQNELVIAGDLLLRYPSVVIRTEEPTIVDQLRRILI
ncbi:MAG: DUF559 domain-containing protein [Jatrophihabitans sp.]